MRATNLKSNLLKGAAIALGILLALPASAQDERTIKRKVAIGRFSNESQYAKGLFYDRENDPMRKQAMDILSSKLAASEKFILLERDDLEVLLKEAGESMEKVGADYLILGSITEFGRKTEGQQKVFSSTKTQTVEAAVSIRLVEAATGLIIYSDESKCFAETSTKQSLGIGGKAAYDATLSDKAISAAISQIVENIINKCLDKPWRSFFMTVEDGTYFIGGGESQGIKVGDWFHVYSKGKVVKNPQTGLDIELPGRRVGVVTVEALAGDSPQTEFSMCSYEGEAIDKENLLKYYISDK